MATVATVNLGPPLTADVVLNGVTIPGASPQCTYRPKVGDQVWLEFLGSDPHISPPLTSAANRAWTALQLSGIWANLGAGRATAGYWRDPVGVIHLRGSLHNGLSGTTVAFTGAATPSLTEDFLTMVIDNTGVLVPARLVVSTSGTLTYTDGPSSPQLLSLSGITYRID